MSGYWLLDWLDSEGIADLEVIDGVLRTPSGYDRMVTAANEARRDLPDPPRHGRSLVAGTGLDLSGVLGCGRRSCLEQKIDDLVHRAWCYFDSVIVTGLDPNEFLFGSSRGGKDANRDAVVNHAAAALHIRDIGAEDLFVFRRKAQLCDDHWNQHAAEAGMPPIDETVNALAEELAHGCVLELKETRGGLEYAFSHPMLEYTTSGVFKKRPKKRDLGRAVARRQAQRLVSGLTRSVWLARDVHGALGQSALQNSRIMTLAGSGRPTVPDVAMTLHIPSIDGASAEQLLIIRREEPDEFDVFRGALLRSIEERIKALPGERAERVGESVVDDVLNPAIAALQLRMTKSARLLGVRSAAAMTVGAVLTTVGLLAFAPLTVPGLVLASSGMAASYHDFLKEHRDVELADLHFLWRADQSLHA